ncbi:MAG: hypothetical protein U5K55_01490 [Aliarcobacter sp.]|nr:hypothetical protein [Aliarcobacter sp.]
MTRIPHQKSWYSENIKKQRNEEMLKFVEEVILNNKIDVIVCYLSGHNTYPEILKKIKSYNIPMVNEALDDERKFVR